MTIRCPSCGSPVMLRGNCWECGWCGDFGEIGSLQPSEKEKLKRMGGAGLTVQITFTVTDSTNEAETPRKYSRAELEDMVRRWDFDEKEWACRDLLIAAFPEAVRFWTAEELLEMDTMELLGNVGERKPEVGIQMMKLLLDTANDHLREPEAAQQLLEEDLYELCRNQVVQYQLIEQLKQDDRLAGQLFSSAYVGDTQEQLLEACDWFGEGELKKRLQALLDRNPCFQGFD